MNWAYLLAAELYDEATRQGLSVSALARKAQMHPQHVGRILNGKGHPPTTRTLARIAAALGCRLTICNEDNQKQHHL